MISIALYAAVFFSLCGSFVHSALPVRILVGSTRATSNGTCPTQNAIKVVKNAAQAQIRQALDNIVLPTYTDRYGPPCSCGGAGEWTRLAYLNMTDPNQQCPSNLTLHTTPVRGCGRRSISNFTCDSIFFPANGRAYSRVCGKILAYQKGAPEAFFNYFIGQNSLDSAYVDGLSLTHGAIGSRQHIWTFVASVYEQSGSYGPQWNCMCTNTNYNWGLYRVPPFVASNYFCDTGNPGPYVSFTAYYTSNPLWDGEGCGPTNTCCQLNNPPWFCTLLTQSTSDDLELRLCNGEHGFDDEDVIISVADIYVN